MTNRIKGRYLYYVIGSLCLVILPWQIGPEFFSTIAGSTIYAFWGIAAWSIVGCILFVTNKKIRIQISATDLFCLTYLIYVWLNLIFMKPVRVDSLVTMEYMILPVFYVCFRYIGYKGQVVLGTALILVALGQSVYGLLQFAGWFTAIHPYFKISGSFFNPAPYAGYIMCLLPIMFGWSLSRNFSANVNIYCKSALFIGIIIALAAIGLSYSRAAWIGCFFGLVFIVWKRYGVEGCKIFQQISFVRRVLTISAAICLLVTACVMLYDLKKDSADGRILVWRNTISMIADHPWEGWGMTQFKAHYMDYQAVFFEQHPAKMLQPADNTVYAFNEYLETASEQGLVGLFIIVAILISLFTTKSRTNRHCMLCSAKAGIIALLLFACFSYPLSILPIKITGLFFISIIASCQRPTYTIKTPASRILSIAFFVLLSFAAYPYCRQLMDTTQAYKTWNDAFYNSNRYQQESCLQQCAAIEHELRYNGIFQSMYGRALLKAGDSQTAVRVLSLADDLLPGSEVLMDMGDAYKLSGQYDKAEEAYNKAWLMIPSRIRPRYLLARLYADTGRKKEAKKVVEETLQQSSVMKHTMASYAVHLKLKALLQQLDNSGE